MFRTSYFAFKIWCRPARHFLYKKRMALLIFLAFRPRRYYFKTQGATCGSRKPFPQHIPEVLMPSRKARHRPPAGAADRARPPRIRRPPSHTLPRACPPVMSHSTRSRSRGPQARALRRGETAPEPWRAPGRPAWWRRPRPGPASLHGCTTGPAPRPCGRMTRGARGRHRLHGTRRVRGGKGLAGSGSV